jgi:hypothetical protein
MDGISIATWADAVPPQTKDKRQRQTTNDKQKGTNLVRVGYNNAPANFNRC